MDYKTVLVTLDADLRAQARLRYAVDLAAHHDAHVLGVALAGGSDFNRATDQEGTHLDAAQLISDAQTRAAAFEQFMRGRSQPFSVRIDATPGGSVADRLAAHGRHCDLFVLGQSGRLTPTLRLDDAFVSTVFTQSGRPALILPPVGDFEPGRPRVVVAWDGSREVVRAIADALALLKVAQRVVLLNVEERHDASLEASWLDEVIGWLARHGVRATSTRRPAVGGIANTLLASAEEEACNLLVMGGYGRRRWSECAFGGVTREVLGRLTLPLLVSH